MGIKSEINAFVDNFNQESIEIVDGLIFNAKELIKTIEFYTNSKYLNGNMDTQGRYKPFYNIVNFRVNVATRATDFDTKDFKLYTENPKHYVKSMLFQKEMKVWMRKTNFAKTLNDFGYIRAKYGGVYVKRVKKDGEIILEIPQWKNLIFNPFDANGTKGEMHYMSPVDIENKKDVWSEMSNEETKAKVKKAFGDNVTGVSRIQVMEVEGVFPKDFLKDGDDGYCLQKHFILMDDDSAVACLHKEEKKDSDYKYLPWLDSPGRTPGIGVVEDGIEAQIATNDAILKQRDIMEAASKVTFVHNSDQLTQYENISDVDFGHLFKIGMKEDMRLLNQTPSSLPELTNILNQWDQQYSRSSSTPDAITGETMPANTPFRSVAIQNQEATSLFNYRKEEAGIFWKEIFTEWIIPHLKTKLTREHILASDFTEEELMVIDKAFATKRANQQVVDALEKGRITTATEYKDMIAGEMKLLEQGVRTERFINIPKNFFKGVEFELDLLTTGEQINKATVFETITNIINTVGQNPQILEDPRLSQLFAKIVELSGIGISPAVFMQKVDQPAVNPAQPGGQVNLNPQAEADVLENA